MVILYPIGITLLFSGLLYTNRAEINPSDDAVTAQMGADGAGREKKDDEEEKEATEEESHADPHIQAQLRVRAKNAKLKRIAFLYESYLPHMWFFEILECLRRLAMTGALSGEWGCGSVVVRRG